MNGKENEKGTLNIIIEIINTSKKPIVPFIKESTQCSVNEALIAAYGDERQQSTRGLLYLNYIQVALFSKTRVLFNLS